MRRFAVDALRKALAVSLSAAITGSAWAQSPSTTTNANQQLIQEYAIASEPSISPTQLLQLLQQNIKYVFVFYQENRSFDHYFGTFPGAEGIYTNPPAQTPGFYQSILNVGGTSSTTIQPFRLDPAIANMYPADTDDVNHSHGPIVQKMDIVNGVAKMDQFATVEEMNKEQSGMITQYSKGYGQLTMAHVDCNTVPISWQYASRFALYDHMFQYFTGPSTPGNIAIMAAQTGDTQWALHPSEAYTLPQASVNNASGAGVPVMGDNDPLWGSKLDPHYPSTLVPSASPSSSPQINLTFASLPMTLQGGQAPSVFTAANDPTNSTDTADTTADIAYLGRLGGPQVPWGWYQEGYDANDSTPGITEPGPAYVTHHNGPQYFGYVANNSAMRSSLHGLNDFFSAVSKTPGTAGALQSGVYWIKGGEKNTLGLTPTDPDVTVQANFLGDDAHPAYSDAQISDAMVATAINGIVNSGYWQNSAIIITYDDSEGDWDHVPPPLLATGPDGTVTTDGPRVPFIVMSPFSKAGYISKGYGTQVSAVRFIDEIFSLPPLATLPNEEIGQIIGQYELQQSNLGPQDGPASGISDLTDSFSPSRLMGLAAPLPGSYALIQTSPVNYITTLPMVSGFGCSTLGITPTDCSGPTCGATNGSTVSGPNTVPGDFNPRPGTNPGAGIQPPVL